MKKSATLVLCILAIHGYSQDTLKTSPSIIMKRHELGLNILPPFLIVCGVFNSQPKFFNTTYRYLLNEHNALRITGGMNVFNNGYYSDLKEAVSITSGLTVYKTTSTHSIANFLVGGGYERIIGKRKLKHVIGFDLTYNYINNITVSGYYGTKDTTHNNFQSQEYVKIDTGGVTKHNYYHKFGITPFYSLRYALSSKWLIVASTRLNFQGYRIKNANFPDITNFDFNTDGLVSEISLFYRF